MFLAIFDGNCGDSTVVNVSTRSWAIGVPNGDWFTVVNNPKRNRVEVTKVENNEPAQMARARRDMEVVNGTPSQDKIIELSRFSQCYLFEGYSLCLFAQRAGAEKWLEDLSSSFSPH